MKTKNLQKFSTMILLITLLLSITPLVKAQSYDFEVTVSGKGKPMILIPGLTCHGDVWNETTEWLSEHYECHVITLPGFAGIPSLENVEKGFLPVMKEQLKEYIKINELKNLTLTGHSLGGFLSLDIAREMPERIEKLVIVDGLPFLASVQMPGATEESMKAMAENMKAGMINQTDEQYASCQPIILNSMILSKEHQDIAMEWALASHRPTVAQAMYELYTTDLRNEISTITSPVLVLGAWIAYKDYGATRESVLATYENQFSQASSVTVKMTDKGKHFIMWDDWDFYQHEVEQFLLSSAVEANR